MERADRIIKVVGIDPSLRNWGIAEGLLDLETKKLRIECLTTVNPVISAGKQVRQNSKDLESALQLYEQTKAHAAHATAVFVEVPVGSKSARAMASYGICVGVLGALRGSGTPFFELSPTEVKMAAVGVKTATKHQMIEWATKQHPEANWPTYSRNGALLVSESTAEHQADAVAAIYAGMACNQFQQMLAFIR